MFRVHYALEAGCLLLLASCSGPVVQIDTRPRVTVLVAKKRINAWTLLSDQPGVHFVYKELPEVEVPRKALREIADLKDKRVNKPINEEAFVTSDDLGNKVLDVAIELPPGTRPVTVGFTFLGGGGPIPGGRVNVVWTTWPKEEGLSQTILRNVLILAIDMGLRKEGLRSDINCLLTLAVRPEDANRLALAALLGELDVTYCLP
jgi:Flp pilus assembly protein CpaB